jgi:hypothetical protein
MRRPCAFGRMRIMNGYSVDIASPELHVVLKIMHGEGRGAWSESGTQILLVVTRVERRTERNSRMRQPES